MKLMVSEETAKWYKDEMGIEQEDYVRIFVKIYGGIPTVYPSYFLGVSIGKEGKIAIKDEVEGITFYITNEDAWLLDNHDLKVVMENGEATYVFEER